MDEQGLAPLQLAVEAYADSHWTWRRSPESVRILLEAAAEAISASTGHEEVDKLLLQFGLRCGEERQSG